MSKKTALIILAAGAGVVGYGLYRTLGTSGTPEVVMVSGQRLDGGQVPAPVQARLLATPSGRVVHFSILLADAHGQTIRSINLPGLKRPVPEVTVVDPRGRIIHQGRFQYG